MAICTCLGCWVNPSLPLLCTDPLQDVRRKTLATRQPLLTSNTAPNVIDYRMSSNRDKKENNCGRSDEKQIA